MAAQLPGLPKEHVQYGTCSACPSRCRLNYDTTGYDWIRLVISYNKAWPAPVVVGWRYVLRSNIVGVPRYLNACILGILKRVFWVPTPIIDVIERIACSYSSTRNYSCSGENRVYMTWDLWRSLYDTRSKLARFASYVIAPGRPSRALVHGEGFLPFALGDMRLEVCDIGLYGVCHSIPVVLWCVTRGTSSIYSSSPYCTT